MRRKTKTGPADRRSAGSTTGDALARRLLHLVRGDWLDGEWTAEAKRFVPSLVIGVYVADREGRRISKRDASTIMNADPATSGPKYIKLAEERGLIEIQRRPAEDRRKDYLVPTKRLKDIVETELQSLVERRRPPVAEANAGMALTRPPANTVVDFRQHAKLFARWSSQEPQSEMAATDRTLPPKSMEARERGLALQRRKEFDDAISEFSKVVSYNPEDHNGYYWRAMAYWDKGEFDLALRDMSTAIRLRPEDNGNYYLLRSRLHAAKGDYEQSLSDLNVFKERVDYPEAASFYIGELNAGFGRLNEAVADFTESIAVAEEREVFNESARRSRAKCRVALGEYKLAVEDYTSLIDFHAGWAGADLYGLHKERAFARYEAKDYVGAIEDYTAAIRIGPGDAALFVSRGCALTWLGKSEQAAADFWVALSLDPRSEDAKKGLRWLAVEPAELTGG